MLRKQRGTDSIGVMRDALGEPGKSTRAGKQISVLNKISLGAPAEAQGEPNRLGEEERGPSSERKRKAGM